LQSFEKNKKIIKMNKGKAMHYQSHFVDVGQPYLRKVSD
jgi:hypothetical protein